MDLRPRECPCCHRLVSTKVCSKYILHGTSYTVRCNHCNAELALVKVPMPFTWCLFAGFMSTTIPAEYFLFVQKLGLAKSLSYAALIGACGIAIIAMLTFQRIYFKTVYD